MKSSRSILMLCLFLAFASGYTVAQENPAQMGTQPQPSATNPPSQQKPAQPAPTTPTQPKTKPPTAPNATVEKPESAAGGTTAPAPKRADLPAKSEPPNAGALQLVQPTADELRGRIE